MPKHTAESLNAHLCAGGYVMVSTQTKATEYGPKWAGAFEQGASGTLYVRHGKRRVALSLPSGALLVRIALSRLNP